MKFKLQPILDLRENMEKVKQRELGVVLGQQMALYQQKQGLKTVSHQLNQMAKEHMSEKIDAYQIQQTKKYMNHIKNKIQKIDTDIHQIEQQVEHKKRELGDAVKQRKIIENLKEIHIEQYLQEQQIQANNLIDELISYKYTAKQRSD